MEKELTLEEQLEIVREVKQALIRAYKYNKDPDGLCFLLLKALNARGYLLGPLDGRLLVDFIPIFTNTNAVKYADARLIEDPGPTGWFWWKLYDYPRRLKFLVWMEEELLKLTETYK